MTDLSVIQEYMLCAVNDKGVIPAMDTEKQVCLVAAGLLELQLEGCVVIEGKTLRAAAPLPEGRAYLEPLDGFIREKEAMKLSALVEAYCLSLTDKRLRALWDAVGGSLAALGLAEAGKAGLLGNKTAYVPCREAVGSVVEMLRAEVLEDGAVSEDAAALAVLLERGKCLKPYFSAFEQKEIREKLRRITASPEGRLVKEMVEHVEGILAAAVAGAVASGAV